MSRRRSSFLLLLCHFGTSTSHSLLHQIQGFFCLLVFPVLNFFIWCNLSFALLLHFELAFDRILKYFQSLV